MKILVAGAGSVGRSISRELISHGHEVTLVDRSPDAMRISSVPDADWQLADACDVDALAEAGAGTADVVVAATGDDKSNLVISLLSKTEYGVPRTVARVNNPKNEWLFDDAWGMDVKDGSAYAGCQARRQFFQTESALGLSNIYNKKTI